MDWMKVFWIYVAIPVVAALVIVGVAELIDYWGSRIH